MTTTVPVPPGRTDRTPRRVDPRIVGAFILAMTGGLVWLGVHVAVAGTADQPVTIAFFTAVLAGIGLLFLASPRGAIVLLLGLGLAWRSIEPRLWALLFGFFSTRVDGRSIGGADLLQVYTPLLVIAASFALAAWRRPPARTNDGRPILATRAVNRIAVPAILLGPPLGLVAWLWLAGGDVYGRPLGVGLLVGSLGLLVFTAYSAFHRLLGRPALAAVLAAAWSVAAVALFLFA